MTLKRTILGALTLGLLMVAGTAHAADWYVDAGVSGGDGMSTATAFDTIQEAIDSAISGDTINIASGTYVEAGQIHITENLTISGDASSKPVIQPTGNFTGANAADA